MREKRVVITGMGVVSPLGCNVDTFFEKLMQGSSNFVKPAGLKKNYPGDPMFVSCVSNDFEETCLKYDLKPIRSYPNYIKLACLQAIQNAELNKDVLSQSDLYIGTSVSYHFENTDYLNAPEGEHSAIIESGRPAAILTDIASALNLRGEVVSFPVACTGGNVAISTGAKKIKYGKKNVCIVGGADYLNDITYSTFYSLNSISKTTCSPFDKNRDGITIGEGAGFLVLEELEHAKKRGATIIAEIIGYDISCDAHHLTTPDPSGRIASLSMSRTLAMANKKPNEISYISPHGTGTRANDLQEANAIYKVFGECSNQIPISPLKSILGHCMAAASAMEAIASAVSITNNEIPSSINYNEIDDEFPSKLNLTELKGREVSAILSTAFAFGGNISCILLSKYE